MVFCIRRLWNILERKVKTFEDTHARPSSRYFLTWSFRFSLLDPHSRRNRGSTSRGFNDYHLKMAFRKFLPMFDRVLVERLAAETMSKGGIMLPEKAQGKVLQATVVAVGPGSTNQKGYLTPMSVKIGEKVLLPEYGGTKVHLEDKEYFLFRDADILGKYVE
ncbi:10 kDa heat shock protein, mitochondrial-like isoform X2 [Oncorhynchus keta]|uniref:10 kDa heat shock protein, mitochondrial-like isoform X2 n=1 Tax=Oncorhynchus keta TaxID=8018 RepID=UPI0015FE40FB|nr:10 kDa heat shock protein, mitochondrial-like isoform X2 [Oncorhynchus keta]